MVEVFIENGHDPVFVWQDGADIRLRIGHYRQGETRYAMLDARQATAVATALRRAASGVRRHERREASQ
jgi:hypothetical protein